MAHEVEITVYFHRETPSAWLVSDDEDIKNAVWLPKSQVDSGGQSLVVGEVFEIMIPEWLANEKDLI